jgi:hypothetical protein
VSIQSFVVKAILERDPGHDQRLRWHGYVTHVPSGDRRAWLVMREVTDFIAERLAAAYPNTEPDDG